MPGVAIPPESGRSTPRAAPDCSKANPNPAHIALAELEAQLPGRYFLCTQNVDDLHERAGSRNLIHMHGELAKARCERECGRPPVEDRAIYASLDEVGRCACGGRMRPHIVFFGEIPLEMPRIEREIAESTLMIVIGTSGNVYPAGFRQLGSPGRRANRLHRSRAAAQRLRLHPHRRRQSRRSPPRAVQCRSSRSYGLPATMIVGLFATGWVELSSCVSLFHSAASLCCFAC
jgi:hypothetical protein